MIAKQFPPLALADWQATRDTVRGYTQVVGAVRAALSPRQKHSGHRSLLAAGTGLTTTPIPWGPLTFEALLDLAAHRVVVTNNHGQLWQHRLRGQSQEALFDEVSVGLSALGISANLDGSQVSNPAPGVYDVAAVERFWQALSQIDLVMKRFKGELRGETSPVQLWPQQMDLAMLWFSGRLMPGQDPNVARDSDERMNLGFSTGDEGIPEPYFYITAYPLPPDLAATPLPPDVEWHTQGWTGALLRYSSLVGAADAEERLLDYFRTVQAAGMKLMKD